MVRNDRKRISCNITFSCKQHMHFDTFLNFNTKQYLDTTVKAPNRIIIVLNIKSFLIFHMIGSLFYT